MLDGLVHRDGRTGPCVAVLKGASGVGKSALALRWLNLLGDRHPDGQLYAGLSDLAGEPVAPSDVLGSFLRALGVPPERVPESLAERTGLYRSVTAELALLVLLDDAVSAAQARVLIPSSPRSVVAVTSQRSLVGLVVDGASIVEVGPLDQSSALELLERHLGEQRVAVERRWAEELVGLCGGLPLALCVVAGLLALRPRRSFAWLVDQLRDEDRRLDVLSVDDDLSVRAQFDLSYRDLPPAAAGVYRAVGMHPGAQFRIELATAAANLSVADTRRAIDELVDASLLEELDGWYYHFHDLVHAHARAMAVVHDEPGIRDATVRRMVEWYLFTAQACGRTIMPARRVLPYQYSVSFNAPDLIEEHRAALGWLERQRLELLAAVRTAIEQTWFELAYLLGDALQPLFILHKHHGEALEVDALGLRAAITRGDHKAEHSMRKRLVRLHLRLGDVGSAEEQAATILRTARARRDRRAEAAGLKSLALLHAERGQHDDAVAAFDASLEILAELGKPRSEGLALIELGHSLVRLGRHDEARDRLDRARHLLSTVEPDRYNAARASLWLAQAHVLLGNHPTAQRLLDEVLPALAELDAVFEEGRAHRVAAELYARTGDATRAEHHRRMADRLTGPAARESADG